MKWLFVTSRFPWPLTHGSFLRVYHLARHLTAAGEDVGVLSTEGPAEGVRAYGEAGIEALKGAAVEDPAMADALTRHAPQADAVVLVREQTLPLAPQARQAAAVIADLIDDPILAGQAVGGAGGLRAWVRRLSYRIGQTRRERRSRKAVDRFVFVTDSDAEAFRRRHRRATTCCIPNGVDADRFDPAAACGFADPAAPAVLFVGNLAYPPNADAARMLIDEVAPALWASHPQARVVVVGPNPPADVADRVCDRVAVTGYVDDVRPYLKAARVVSLPVQSGTGIKNKLLEAWSMAAAVVASPQACGGTPAEDGTNVLIASDAATHASAIGRLIDDDALCVRLGEAGRTVVTGGLTWRHAADRLRQCAQEIGS